MRLQAAEGARATGVSRESTRGSKEQERAAGAQKARGARAGSLLLQAGGHTKHLEIPPQLFCRAPR